MAEAEEGHVLSLLVVEAGEAVDGREGEEEEKRVEQDETRNDRPGKICQALISALAY